MKIIIILLISLFLGFIIGFYTNIIYPILEEIYQEKESKVLHNHLSDNSNHLSDNSNHLSDNSNHLSDNSNHSHKPIEVSKIGPIPSVNLIINNDSSGWNLQIISENFKLTPENVNFEHIPNEGHIHFYIDGKKITRIYSEWYNLPSKWVPENSKEFKITLSTNDHRDYTFNGNVISDIKEINSK